MMVNTKVTVMWYVTSYSLVNRCRSSEETTTFFSKLTVEKVKYPEGGNSWFLASVDRYLLVY